MNVKEWLEKVANKEDLKLYINEQYDHTYYIEFEYWSGLGEDVIISLVVDEFNIDEIQESMYIEWQNFNAEEHAVELYNLRGQYGTPRSIRALLQDADEQDKKLEQVYNTMLELDKIR